MTNSIESLGTSQSFASYSDAIEDKSEVEVQTLPKETADREGYSACNEDSDEERAAHIIGRGIDIPLVNPNNLSATSAATTMPKRPHYESTQNYRKTLRLSSEQIVSITS